MALKRLAASHGLLTFIPECLVLVDESGVYFWVEACGLKCRVLVKKKKKKKEFKNMSYDFNNKWC